MSYLPHFSLNTWLNKNLAGVLALLHSKTIKKKKIKKIHLPAFFTTLCWTYIELHSSVYILVQCLCVEWLYSWACAGTMSFCADQSRPPRTGTRKKLGRRWCHCRTNWALNRCSRGKIFLTLVSLFFKYIYWVFQKQQKQRVR